MPLNKALQEYAGSKNKKALINLLSPMQLAAESSPLMHELINSGDIYHPLAWNPHESYQFLQEVKVDCKKDFVFLSDTKTRKYEFSQKMKKVW